MKESILLVVICCIVMSCKSEEKRLFEEQQQKIESVDAIMWDSETSLVEKYELIKSEYYDLPMEQQIEYGKSFFSSMIDCELVLVENEPRILISGMVFPQFENSFFQEAVLDISVALNFPNKKFLAINQVKGHISEKIIYCTAYQKIDNSGLRLFDGGEEYGSVGKEYLKYKADKLIVTIDIKVQNQINDRYTIRLDEIDFTDQWNKIASDEEAYWTFINKGTYDMIDYNRWLKIKNEGR